MGKGRVTETERMPRLVVGNTELLGSKLKRGNRFAKPNSELLPSYRQVQQVRRVHLRKYPGWAVNDRFSLQRSLSAAVCAAKNRPFCATKGH
jgi:hypothetical protein